MNFNLFSIFDPTTSMDRSMNMIVLFMIFLFVIMFYYCVPSFYQIFLKGIFNFMYKEFCVFLTSSLGIMIFIYLLMFIFIFNFMGLFPYVYTITSHISFTVSFSLMIWLSLMLYGWLKNYNNMFCHLVPQGTPVLLMPFMVLIESVSLLIRPITLSVRLAANMIAGHLLLCLIGSLGPHLFYCLLVIMLIQITLMLLEMGVSIIQAYVFSVLCSLYSSEV